MPVSRTQALPLLNRARVFYLRGGEMVPSVVTSGTRSGASVTKQAWRSQQKIEKATAPLPFQFVMPVSRTQALPLLNRARVFFLRGGGMVPSVVTSGCPKRGERIFRKRPQGARSEARAGSLRRRGGNIRSTASRTDTSQLRSTIPP